MVNETLNVHPMYTLCSDVSAAIPMEFHQQSSPMGPMNPNGLHSTPKKNKVSEIRPKYNQHIANHKWHVYLFGTYFEGSPWQTSKKDVENPPGLPMEIPAGHLLRQL